MYSSLVEEFIFPLMKVHHRLSDVIATSKLCGTQVFFSATDVSTNYYPVYHIRLT